jgi:hypothetical protein
MIEVIKEIEDDYFLINLVGTRQYQLWHIEDLLDTIQLGVEENIHEALNQSSKKFTIWNDNSDIDEDKLKRLTGYIKEFKLEKIELDKQK